MSFPDPLDLTDLLDLLEIEGPRLGDLTSGGLYGATRPEFAPGESCEHTKKVIGRHLLRFVPRINPIGEDACLVSECPNRSLISIFDHRPIIALPERATPMRPTLAKGSVCLTKEGI